MDDNHGPLFVGTGDSAPRSNDFEERNAVIAVVRDPKTRKFLTLTWNSDGRKTFVTGGIEDGQSAEEAALIEIKEETGYSNLVLICKLPSYQAQFFHPQKNLDRYAYFQCFFFELVTEKRTIIDQKESNLHQPTWLSLAELRAQITEEGPLFLIDYIVSKGL